MLLNQYVTRYIIAWTAYAKAVITGTVLSIVNDITFLLEGSKLFIKKQKLNVRTKIANFKSRLAY